MGRARKQAPPARGLREPCRPTRWRSQKEARLFTELAKVARALGQSHRGYKVGAAAKIRTKTGRTTFSLGANKKNSSGPRTLCAYCAEEDAERLARALKVQEILCLVVYAAPEPDDASGREEEVPIPCWYCRKRWRKQIASGTGPVTERTIIRRINADHPEKWMEDWMGAFLETYADDPEKR